MPFTLAIQTPTAPVFEGEVDALVAPGIDGSLGVLAHHAPLIAALGPGNLEARLADGTTKEFFVSGGFMEVSNNRAMVLADTLELVESLEVASAEAALEEALGEQSALAEQHLLEARARLRAAKRRQGGGR